MSALKWYKIRVKQIWSLSSFIHFLQNLPDFDWFWPTLIFSQDQVKLIISWWITMLYHKVRYGNGAWHHWHAIQIDKCCHRMCSHEICPLFYVCGPHSNNSGTSSWGAHEEVAPMATSLSLGNTPNAPFSTLLVQNLPATCPNIPLTTSH